MKRITLLILLTFVSLTQISAQYFVPRNMVWAFGDGAGVDFSSGTPVSFASNINTYESCASVSNKAGGLLFYTDAKRVYDRNGTLMPSAASIVPYGTVSTVQGAVIVPFPGDTNKYYIFSLENIEDTTNKKCQLSYSVVDMSLNGGLGDIVPGAMGIPMYDSLGEGMIAIPGNYRNAWLLVHLKDTALFLAYQVSATGISAPVISAVGAHRGINCYMVPFLAVSSDRRKIAQANLQRFAELYDFDPLTGIVSNSRVLDDSTGDKPFSLAFSPDDTKLYINWPAQQKIMQYDVTLPSIAAIKASRIKVADSASHTHLRLAPDGKIYFKGRFTDYLNCITLPNNSGAACGYVAKAVQLQAGTNAGLGLPALVVSVDSIYPNAVVDLGINEDIVLYPVPADRSLTISASVAIETLVIYNSMGQVVDEQTPGSNKVQVNVAALSKGIYFARINGSITRPFILQ